MGKQNKVDFRKDSYVGTLVEAYPAPGFRIIF